MSIEQQSSKNDNVFTYLYETHEREKTHKELLRAEQEERERKEETFVPIITNLAQCLSKKYTERRQQHTFERLHNLHKHTHHHESSKEANKFKELISNSKIEASNNIQANYEQKLRTTSTDLQRDNKEHNILLQIGKMNAGKQSVVEEEEQETTCEKESASEYEENKDEVETLSNDCTFKPNITPASEILSRVYYQQHAMDKLNVYDRLYNPSHSISAARASSTNALTPLWNTESNELYKHSDSWNEHFSDDEHNKCTESSIWNDKRPNTLPAHMYKIDNYLCQDRQNNHEHTESHTKSKKLQEQPLWEIDTPLTHSNKIYTAQSDTSVAESCHAKHNASRNDKKEKTCKVSECTNCNCTFRPHINRTSQELWERKVQQLKAHGMAATVQDARRVMEHEAQMRKENELALIQEEQDEKEMHECTFQPFASEHHKRKEEEQEEIQRSHSAGLNREYVHMPFIERTKLYEQQRKNEQHALRTRYDEELKQECSFVPNIHNFHNGTKQMCNAQIKKRSLSNASARLTSFTAPTSYADAWHTIPGYTKHIERQRLLQHRKSQEDIQQQQPSLSREFARLDIQEEEDKNEKVHNNTCYILKCEQAEECYDNVNNVCNKQPTEKNNNEETLINSSYDIYDYDSLYRDEEYWLYNRSNHKSVLDNNRVIDRSNVLVQRDVNVNCAWHCSPGKQKQKCQELSTSANNTLITCTASTAQWIPQLKYNATSMHFFKSVQ